MKRRSRGAAAPVLSARSSAFRRPSLDTCHPTPDTPAKRVEPQVVSCQNQPRRATPEAAGASPTRPLPLLVMVQVSPSTGVLEAAARSFAVRSTEGPQPSAPGWCGWLKPLAFGPVPGRYGSAEQCGTRCQARGGSAAGRPRPVSADEPPSRAAARACSYSSSATRRKEWAGNGARHRWQLASAASRVLPPQGAGGGNLY